MNKYDYYKAVADDVYDYITEEINLREWEEDFAGLEEKLNEDL